MKKTVLACILSSATLVAMNSHAVNVGSVNLNKTHSAEAFLKIQSDLGLRTEINVAQTGSKIGNQQVVFQARLVDPSSDALNKDVYLGVGAKTRADINEGNKQITLKNLEDGTKSLTIEVADRGVYTYTGMDNEDNMLVYKLNNKFTKESDYSAWLTLIAPFEQTSLSGTFALKSNAYIIME